MTVDLPRLRAALAAKLEAASKGCARMTGLELEMEDLFDELESFRAEVTRLGSALLLSDAYVERAAIVAYGRKVEHQIASFDANTAAMLFGFLNEIEHGDHLARLEDQP